MRTPPPPRLGSPATMKGDNEQMTVVKVGRTKTGNKNNKWSGKRLTTVIKMKEFWYMISFQFLVELYYFGCLWSWLNHIRVVVELVNGSLTKPAWSQLKEFLQPLVLQAKAHKRITNFKGGRTGKIVTIFRCKKWQGSIKTKGCLLRVGSQALKSPTTF